jgi:hypothetical protein
MSADLFNNLTILNEFMLPGDKKVKFILGVPINGQFIPIVSKSKLDDIYDKLDKSSNFKYSCINKKIDNDIILSDDLKLYQEVETVFHDILCLIPGWTHSFRAVVCDVKKNRTRKQFNDSCSIKYHCDRFEYKSVWEFDLITLTRSDNTEIYIFELVFNCEKLLDINPGHYIQSAVAKILDFSCLL